MGMRSALIPCALLIVVAGCGAEAAAAHPDANTTPVEQAPVTAKKPRVAPTLRGTVAGRPFTAVSALMVYVNRPMRACSSKLTGTGSCSTDTDGFDIHVSSLHIYERAVSCADLGDDPRRRELRMMPGERRLELEMQGTWPVARGSTWKVDREGPPDPRQDYVQTTTFVVAGAQTNSLGYGEVRFAAATRTEGTLTVALSALTAEAGSVLGDVPFTVCPWP